MFGGESHEDFSHQENEPVNEEDKGPKRAKVDVLTAPDPTRQSDGKRVLGDDQGSTFAQPVFTNSGPTPQSGEGVFTNSGTSGLKLSGESDTQDSTVTQHVFTKPGIPGQSGEAGNQKSSFGFTQKTGTDQEQDGSYWSEEGRESSGTGDNNGTGTDTSDNESITKMLNDFRQDSNMKFIEWVKRFGASEEFEVFCPRRLDQLLHEAQELEQSLTQQKEQLRMRLHLISTTLHVT